MDIRQQIVEDQIEKVNAQLKLEDKDVAFQIFGHCLFSNISIHSFNPNDDVDGGQDKQIDCISVVENQGEGIIYITQIKNEESFKSNAIIQIRNGLHWIFNKRKADIETLANKKFKDKILECKDLVSLIGPSNIEVKVAYISNGFTDNLSDECEQELNTISQEFDNDTFSSFSFQTIGAIEIVDLLNSQEKKNKKIDAEIPIKYDANSPSLIKYHSHGLKGIICSANAQDLAKIVNEDSKGFLFDLNIRRFLGNRGGVNRDIKETSTNEDSSHLFWFLNNGVTIVCDKVDPVTDPDNPHLKIKNMQIVNGCQTSTSLAKALEENLLQDNVNLILKVFETADLELVDKIVLTTNNQNKITNRNLRANDRIQRDLEKAFTIHNYFYERKPRQFLNEDSSKIIPNEDVATSYLSLVLKRPSDARSRKYKIWNEYYDSIFKPKTIEAFLVSYLIRKLSFKFVNSSDWVSSDDDTKRYVAKNAQYHIARCSAFIWRKSDNWTDENELKNQLKKIEKNEKTLNASIKKAFNLVLKILKKDKKYMADLNNALKSSKLDNELSKELHTKYGA